jgi:hypothetical protein
MQDRESERAVPERESESPGVWVLQALDEYIASVEEYRPGWVVYRDRYTRRKTVPTAAVMVAWYPSWVQVHEGLS